MSEDVDPTPAESEAQESASLMGQAEIPAGQLAAWAEQYGTQARQLRRYIRMGRERSDPCPLDEPTKMPAWWTRNMKHRVPPKILLAAQKAGADAPAATDTDPSAPGTPATDAIAGGIDMDATTLDDGEEVKIARSLVASFKEKLSSALKDNKPDDVAMWNRHLREGLETLRKAKIDDRAAKKERGLMKSVAEVECEVFAAAKMIAALFRSMAKRVCEDLKSMRPEMEDNLLEQIRDAILAIGKRGEDALRTLKCLTKADDVTFRLDS